jgi:rare lipoprotein A
VRRAVGVVIVSLGACLSGCAARVPPASPSSSATKILETREGLASYYGKEFHGRKTASGIRFDMNAMVAAHPSYPFGTRLRVTNLSNGRSASVRIVDRGPAQQVQEAGSSSICLARPQRSLGLSSKVAHAFDWTCWRGAVVRREQFVKARPRCCRESLHPYSDPVIEATSPSAPGQALLFHAK